MGTSHTYVVTLVVWTGMGGGGGLDSIKMSRNKSLFLNIFQRFYQILITLNPFYLILISINSYKQKTGIPGGPKNLKQNKRENNQIYFVLGFPKVLKILSKWQYIYLYVEIWLLHIHNLFSCSVSRSVSCYIQYIYIQYICIFELGS